MKTGPAEGAALLNKIYNVKTKSVFLEDVKNILIIRQKRPQLKPGPSQSRHLDRFGRTLKNCR